jgi:hypothetical protein
MGFVALQANLAFFNRRVLFNFIGKLGEPLRFTDEFGVTVKTLPTGLVDDFCGSYFFVTANVDAQWAMAAFAGQVFMFSLLNVLNHIFVTGSARVISAMKHWFFCVLG